MSMDHYVGQLVVLRSRWNIHSNRLGIVIEKDESLSDVLVVAWTDVGGIKIRKHVQDAILPVTEETIKKIEERICAIK